MLKDKIQSDLKNSQLAKDASRTEVLRMLWSEIRYGEINASKEFEDSDVIAVIQKEVKKRNEAAEGFRKGGRVDQVEKEEQEAQILMTYLPAQLSDGELEKIINEAITQTGASVVSDMGKVIAVVMGKVAGKAEGARVSTLVKEKLSNG